MKLNDERQTNRHSLRRWRFHCQNKMRVQHTKSTNVFASENPLVQFTQQVA